MSYRRSKATTERIRRQIEAMRRGKERAAMARATRDYPPPLPELRRVVTITDYDTGEPVTHELRLLRSRRVDSYRVLVDGQPWHQAACARHLWRGPPDAAIAGPGSLWITPILTPRQTAPAQSTSGPSRRGQANSVTTVPCRSRAARSARARSRNSARCGPAEVWYSTPQPHGCGGGTIRPVSLSTVAMLSGVTGGPSAVRGGR